MAKYKTPILIFVILAEICCLFPLGIVLNDQVDGRGMGGFGIHLLMGILIILININILKLVSGNPGDESADGGRKGDSN